MAFAVGRFKAKCSTNQKVLVVHIFQIVPEEIFQKFEQAYPDFYHVDLLIKSVSMSNIAALIFNTSVFHLTLTISTFDPQINTKRVEHLKN